MKSKSMKLVFFIIIGIILFVVFSYNLEKYYIKSMHNHPIVYCYEDFSGVTNPPLLITNLRFKDSLLNYYKKLQQGQNPSFNFPLESVFPDKPVYFLGYYQKDTLLGKIYIDFDGRDETAYTYRSIIHKSPPNM
jgi:hypothetical protein